MFEELLIDKALNPKTDSDAHHITIFALTLASKAKTIVELGVREGGTTLPLLYAASMLDADLFSVDLYAELPPKNFPITYEKHYWIQSDAISYLENNWDKNRKIDICLIDDWHAYEHVKKELELLDKYTGPSSIILLHDLMYGNTEPFYHADLTLKEGQWAGGGPYRAVAELNNQFWEWSTLPWANGLTILRKKYSSKFHRI